MNERLRHLRRKIVTSFVFGIALCTAASLFMLWSQLSATDLDGQRQELELLANTLFDNAEDIEMDTGSNAAVVVGTPSWVKLLVESDGSVSILQRSGNAATELDANTAAALINLRDENGSEPFGHGDETWIGLWLPANAEDDALTISSNGSITASTESDDGEADSARVYTFLEISDHVTYTQELGLWCVCTCILVAAIAFALAWFTAGRMLHPVAEAEERKRTFICTASHNLKTPLMAITANCDVLDSEASEQQPTLSPWITNIRTSADDMAAQIASMLSQLEH